MCFFVGFGHGARWKREGMDSKVCYQPRPDSLLSLVHEFQICMLLFNNGLFIVQLLIGCALCSYSIQSISLQQDASHFAIVSLDKFANYERQALAVGGIRSDSSCSDSDCDAGD